MELNIINKKQDPLFSRIKVESEIIFEKGTPSIAEVKSKLGKDFGKDEKLIVVKGIYTQYGLKKAKNLSYVYENEEALKRIEVGKKEKTGKKEAKPKEEEKPEAKKEEQKPKEEQKSEKKEAKPEEKQEEQKAKESKTGEKPKEKKAPDKEKKQ